MNLKNKRIGFALPSDSLPQEIYQEMAKLVARGAEIIPFLLERETKSSTFFSPERDNRLLRAAGKKLLADPPLRPLDLLVIAPCSSRVIQEVTDTGKMTVLSPAVRQHLDSKRPTVLALWTRPRPRDLALNISRLIREQNIFFVPFGPLFLEHRREAYLVSRLDLIAETAASALLRHRVEHVMWEHQTPP